MPPFFHVIGAGMAVAISPTFDFIMDYTGAISSSTDGTDGLYGVLGGGFLYHF